MTLEPGIHYIVTKGSDDGTLEVGDHIWLERGLIHCREAQGWIAPEDTAEAMRGVEVAVGGLMLNTTAPCTFYVIMLKRQDGQVYADLAKTTQQIFLTEHEAQDALANLSCGSWHILQMQARLERVINEKERE